MTAEKKFPRFSFINKNLCKKGLNLIGPSQNNNLIEISGLFHSIVLFKIYSNSNNKTRIFHVNWSEEQKNINQNLQ